MTKTVLAPDRRAAALDFLAASGRPLEAARSRYHFDGGSREDVLAALAPFQNDDGGFGHAIEPDLRAPESSAIGTSVALQVLREIGAVAPSTMVDRAVQYLRRTFKPGMAGWRIVPLEVESSPHAPWWSQTGRDAGYDVFSLNPNAELLGYLLELGEATAGDVRQRVTEAVCQTLASADAIEMHELLGVLRLAASPGLPSDLAAILGAKLPGWIQAAVVVDPAAWGGYGLRPLQVVDDPTSRFLPELATAVEANLDYEIAGQQADGSWMPSWTWGDAYPDVWPKAAREWAGVLTLQNLRTLKRFGRVEQA